MNALDAGIGSIKDAANFKVPESFQVPAKSIDASRVPTIEPVKFDVSDETINAALKTIAPRVDASLMPEPVPAKTIDREVVKKIMDNINSGKTFSLEDSRAAGEYLRIWGESPLAKAVYAIDEAIKANPQMEYWAQQVSDTIIGTLKMAGELKDSVGGAFKSSTTNKE
jgi:hypothetical protein